MSLQKPSCYSLIIGQRIPSTRQQDQRRRADAERAQREETPNSNAINTSTGSSPPPQETKKNLNEISDLIFVKKKPSISSTKWQETVTAPPTKPAPNSTCCLIS